MLTAVNLAQLILTGRGQLTAVNRLAPAERGFNPDWSGRVMAVVPILAVILFFVTGTWLWFLAIPLAGALLFGTDRERKAKRRRERDSD